MAELFNLTQTALTESDPRRKCDQAAKLFSLWLAGDLEFRPESEIILISDPGRPESPELVDPRKLQRRSFATEPGRICLLHSFAHIEFNAINIALDAVYRFRNMPRKFVDDWLLVASEEAYHFSLLSDELNRRGSSYGAFPAHRGLWDMVCKTASSALERMAMVPRVMEARGLDVSPGMISRFQQFGDHKAAEILQVIYGDEIGHVRIGNDWYQYLCRQQGLDADKTFRDLIIRFMGGHLRGPFNREARIAAGFALEELEMLEQVDP